MNPPWPIPEVEPSPFEELATGFQHLRGMWARLNVEMVPGLDPLVLAELADAGASLLRTEERLLDQWRWQMGQPYPATN